MPQADIDRRTFLKGAAGTTAAMVVTAAYSRDLLAQETDYMREGYSFFSPSEVPTVEALAEQIWPGDENTVGGRDAGVAVYIDRALAARTSICSRSTVSVWTGSTRQPATNSVRTSPTSAPSSRSRFSKPISVCRRRPPPQLQKHPPKHLPRPSLTTSRSRACHFPEKRDTHGGWPGWRQHGRHCGDRERTIRWRHGNWCGHGRW